MSTVARREPMAWLDRISAVTVALVCTSLCCCLTMFKEKGVEQKTAHGKPVLRFSGKQVIGKKAVETIYRDVLTD